VTNVETQVWSGATPVLDIQTPAPMPFGSAVQLYAALPAATV